MANKMKQEEKAAETVYIKSKERPKREGEEEDKEEAEEDLEDQDLELIRQKRLEEMKKTMQRNKEFLAMGHGKYSEIVEEEFLSTVSTCVSRGCWMTCSISNRTRFARASLQCVTFTTMISLAARLWTSTWLVFP